ncbi:MAG: SDR family oxidoreductase [Streptosporangiales bacterium]|nr:SDR family oxidoreductase [Streptosporangiales bacterium]
MTETHEGQRVVITGATGVFGEWISAAFARGGAELLLTDGRAEPLEQLASRLAAQGAQVHTQPADLTSPADIEALTARCGELWGSPDALVNNAGIYPRGWLLDMTREHFQHILDVNLLAPFQLTQAVARQMIDNDVAGSIVNLSSGAAHSTQPGGGPYSTSKAAVAMFTRACALELAPYGIRVNAVSPGFAPGSEVSQLDESHIDAMTTSIPLGRTSGPQDAPEAVLFLCSDRASFITSSTITVDGGRTAGTFNAAKHGRPEERR